MPANHNRYNECASRISESLNARLESSNTNLLSKVNRLESSNSRLVLSNAELSGKVAKLTDSNNHMFGTLQRVSHSFLD